MFLDKQLHFLNKSNCKWTRARGGLENKGDTGDIDISCKEYTLSGSILSQKQVGDSFLNSHEGLCPLPFSVLAHCLSYTCLDRMPVTIASVRSFMCHPCCVKKTFYLGVFHCHQLLYSFCFLFDRAL